MLRITEKEEGKDKRVLYLEGKICQEWVRELNSVIIRGIREGKKVILDFSKVSFLDEEATKMINQFSSDQVGKRNCSLFIQSMLNSEGRK